MTTTIKIINPMPSWWSGDSRVEQFMIDISQLLNKEIHNTKPADPLIKVSETTRLQKANTTIAELEAKLAKSTELIKGVVKAWEVLPEGNYSMNVIENWICKDMNKAINDCRDELKTNKGG